MRKANELQSVTSDYLHDYVDNKFSEVIERAAQRGDRHVQIEISESDYFEYTHRNTLLYRVKQVIEGYGYKVNAARIGVGFDRRTGGHSEYKYYLRITW